MGMYDVQRFCDECGEWRTIRAARKTERDPNVKCRKHMRKKAPTIGRTFVHATGYVGIRTEGGYDYEHRVVWAAAHGPIPDGYHVHHLNHVRDDNRLENLVLVHGRAHNREHTTERHEERSLDNRGPLGGNWRHDLDDAEIIRRREAGQSWRAIAEAVGTSHVTARLHYLRATEPSAP